MPDFLQVQKIEDPRGSLDKARRREMLDYAKANNIQGIVPGMPANGMRGVLRGLGINSIPIPRRILGVPEPGSAPIGKKPPAPHGGTQALEAVARQNGPSVDASDDLMRQWESQQNSGQQAAIPPEPASSAPVPQETVEAAPEPLGQKPAVQGAKSPLDEYRAARKQCNELGIPVARTDKLADLKAKLDGQGSSGRDE